MRGEHSWCDLRAIWAQVLGVVSVGESMQRPRVTRWGRISVRALLVVALVSFAGLVALPSGSSTSAAVAAGSPDFGSDLPIPSNAQIGTGDLTINCSVTIGGVPAGTAAVDSLSGGILPTIVRPGQALWVTSIRARTTLPVSVTNQLYALGARKVQVQLLKSQEMLTGGANSTADLVDANHISIPTITLVPGQPIVTSLGDKTPLKLGPLQTQGPGVAHLAIGETETQATVENAQGTSLFTTLTDCPTPNPPQLLATVRVAGKPGTGQVSIPGTYPARYVPADSLVGSTGFRYTCQFAGIGTFAVDGSGTQFGDFGPRGLVFTAGQRIYFQDTQGQILLSPKLVNHLLHAVGGQSDLVRLTMDHVHVTSTDFLPAKASLVSSPVVGTTGRLQKGKSLRLSYPQAGTVLKPFYLTAGSRGIGDEWLGDEAFTLQPVTSGGNTVGSPVRASCPTPQPLVPVFPAVVEAEAQ